MGAVRLATSSHGGPLRVLMLGPIHSPHTAHLAVGAAQRGCEVLVGGEEWEKPLEDTYGQHGIPLSVQRWPTARWLRGLLSSFRPDVVHANWLHSAFVYLLYGATPMAAMAWGSDVYRANFEDRLRNRVVVRCAGMVLADSIDLLGALRALGASPKRSRVINWGVDVGRFSRSHERKAELRDRLGLPAGRMILSPRALREMYNPGIVIDAFDRLADVRRDVFLVVKHMHAEPPSLAGSRHPERVRVIGHVPYEQMADYYRAADVCVSIPSSDSSPRSVWEAMACGTPCVLSDLPWVYELIRPGREAMVAPIDASAVAESIGRVLDDSQLAHEMGQRASALVGEHRNRERELDSLIEVYERLALERPGASRAARALQAATAGMAMGAAVARRAVASARDGRTPSAAGEAPSGPER